MSAEAEKALIQSTSLPSVTATAQSSEIADSFGTWGLVFGGDATLEAAKQEVTATAKKMEITDATVFRRAGSFRSVKTFVNRAEAAGWNQPDPSCPVEPRSPIPL